MTQVDARLDGISLPDTTVSTSSTQSGIYYTLLSDIDASYGNITKVTNPTDMVVDSVFFYIGYENDFMGDSTALQAINVYALNNTLPTNKKLYTNIKVSDYCDKDTLLGSLAYQVKTSGCSRCLSALTMANGWLRLMSRAHIFHTSRNSTNCSRAFMFPILSTRGHYQGLGCGHTVVLSF